MDAGIEIPLTPAEEEFRARSREVYNRGDVLAALVLAQEFLEKHPTSTLARVSVAVYSGDLAESKDLPLAEKERLMAFAVTDLAAIREAPWFPSLPEFLRRRVLNEFYWYSKAHVEQYRLGVEDVKKGNIRGGSYSQCVGAASQARKLLLAEGKTEDACQWAEASLKAFRDFERLDPHWSNINAFAARALAVLGRYDEARDTFLGTFRKQGMAPYPAKVSEFEEEISELRAARELRGDLHPTPVPK